MSVVCSCTSKSNLHFDKMIMDCISCKKEFHAQCANISKLQQVLIYSGQKDYICTDCRHNILVEKYFKIDEAEGALHELIETFGDNWEKEFER